jgi:hypothetical protein
MRLRRFPGKDRGTILVALLILIIVAALIGVWGLSSSRIGFLRAGHFRGSTKLDYQAEEAIQKALTRFRQIADLTLTDSMYGYRGDYAYQGSEHDISWLVSTATFPDPATVTGVAPQCLDRACPEPFDPEVGLDSTGCSGQISNVICNFLGKSSPDAQVAVVRKADFTEGTKKYAIYLVNATARDGVGRKRLVQGVVVLPYEVTGASTYALPAGESPYLATIVKSGGD